jgi:hypothetical protein
MSQNVGTLISAAIRPNDSLDPIASAFASEIKGGFHTATSSTDRDAIIVERREWGMMCYVINDNKTYQLTYAYSSTSIIDNSNWKEFSGAGSGGSGNEWIDSVLSVTFSQPGSPINGDRYLVGRNPSDSISWGTWSQPGFVAQWNSSLSNWDITIPTNGMSVRVDNEDNSIYRYEGNFDTGQWEKEMLGQVRSITSTTINGTSYSVTMDPPIGGYVEDMIFLTKFNATNTGSTVSLNINGLGEKLIKRPSSTGLSNLNPLEIEPSFVYSLAFDGTYFQMIKPFEEGVFDIKYYIEPTDYVIVPQYYQYWVYGDLTISGYLENYGNVIIMNGGLILTGGTFSNFGQLLLFSSAVGLTPSFNNSDTIQFTQQSTLLGLSVSSTIINGSITQSKLDITNPSSGTAGSLLAWTASGEFMWVDGSSFGVIGQAEDGDYTDGIFTDFTPTTPIGTAVDRFNEMLLLLAPTPPSNWNNAITSIGFTNTSYSARALSTSSPVTIYSTTTPTLTNVDIVGSQSSARVDTSGLTFSLVDNGSQIELVTLSGTATAIKNTGNIRHSASQDPYSGVSGKAGFWTGIIDFSLSGNLPAITPSSSQRLLELYHPGIDSPETFYYYIDNPLTVTIGTITASVPSMTSYISGVPTLTTSDTITSIGFSVSNVSSYFYAATSVYQINAGIIAGSTGDPNTIPSAFGETGNVTGKSGAIQTNQFSDLSISFTVRGRNSIGTYGSNTTFTSTSHRVDTVSSESARKTSGSGSYPASGYNGVFDSTQSLVGTYTEELQLRNGIYVYPSVNYTSIGGPDYSSASGTRWATFNIGTFTNNSAFTLNINGSSGISSIGQANLLIEVKIEGATFWVDGDAAYSGTGNPGSVSDGVAAVVIGSSTATSRRITFGAVTYSGSIIVRIGFTGTGLQFTNLTATSIV